ncbi:MAG: diaminopimelate decarboxylase [Alphaproteobacteria bacterium]|nr:diaminopimelate decarboxylase [Alphaproteobacteria bacterium]
MNHFHMKDGALHAEAVAIARIAAAVGTPFYCYSTATLERHYRVFADAFSDVPATICYALKANGNLAVVRVLADLGAGADVVSGGELKQALAAGVPAERIVFSGVGKTVDEMSFAMAAGILQFNVESPRELEILNDLAVARGPRTPIALRVNPDVDAKTQAKISTGIIHNKFGVAAADASELCRRAAELPGLELVGLAMHIGSQLTDLGPLQLAFERLAEMTRDLRAEGHAIERLDLGGGLGIRYQDETPPTPKEYAAMIARATDGLDLEIVLEPGRAITGDAGVLLTRVLYVKKGVSRTFVIVDAAMNDLMRPSLYDAHHDIIPAIEPAPDADEAVVDVVGPVCETGDFLARDRAMPVVHSQDLLAIGAAGAYGAVMASTYNSRPLVAEVLVKDGDFAVIRPRQSYDDMLGAEKMPDWLEDAQPLPSTQPLPSKGVA